MRGVCKCIFFFGLESSGTRYLARNVAHMIQNNSTWNGEYPACFETHGAKLVHISLPYAESCSQTAVPPVRSKDLCTRPTTGRYIANISDMLTKDVSCKAIIITRSEWERRSSSIASKHCQWPAIMRKEEELSFHIIHQAVLQHPARTLLLSYEWVSSMQHYLWSTIAKFIGVVYLARSEPGTDQNAKQLHAFADGIADDIRKRLGLIAD